MEGREGGREGVRERRGLAQGGGTITWGKGQEPLMKDSYRQMGITWGEKGRDLPEGVLPAEK